MNRFGWVVARLLIIFSISLPVYSADVPLVEESHLLPQHWLSESGNTPMLTVQQITAFNQQLLQQNAHMADIFQLASPVDKAGLLAKIDSISAIPRSARFYTTGEQLTDKDFERYRGMLNVSGIAPHTNVQYGLVTKRTSLRTFPTTDRVLNSEMDADLDRFQESGLFPGEAVAIWHSSQDGEWLLVQNYHYLAWAKASDIAIGSKQRVQEFTQASDFLLVTGAKVFTNYVPDDPDISQLQLDMGVRLPRIEPSAHQLYGQNPYASYMVKLPVRGSDGSLTFKPALIARSQDVQIGYMTLTANNIVRQAFKFLGERYGWGHDYNGRDCTGFVGEIYKTFGLLMPRNSGQQGSGEYGINWRFERNQAEAVTARLQQLQVGDLIYIPGHVMLYIGQDNGQPFVIHDVKGLAYTHPDGAFYRGTLNGVSVTPVLPLHLNKDTRYIDRVYNIKRVTEQVVQ